MNPIIQSLISEAPAAVIDQALVEHASAAMLAKLAKKRDQGRSGWQGPSCSISELQTALAKHVAKGDPVDVMNIAAMIHFRQSIYGEKAVPTATIATAANRFRRLSSTLAVDDKTHLMWGPTLSDKMTHAKAEEVVKTLLLGGFTDWRLPTIDELETLRDRTRYKPATHEVFAEDTKPEWYWTGTPVASDPAGCAWIVGFGYGDSYICNRNGRAWVRPVRASQ